MESIWLKTDNRRKHPALKGSIRTQVAIVGGGMAGILTAWKLQEAGMEAVVLEAGRIGGGQTKNTTAKITSQHGLFCRDFIEKKGEAAARAYLQANQEAVEEYKRLIESEQIDCDLTEQAAYVYGSDEEALKREAEAARKLGMEASFCRELEIPVSCAGAVCFPGQAAFHPLKFLGALAEKLTVYEESPATIVGEHKIKTPKGEVEAEKIVFASHFPFVDFPGLYFARMHQERSYVLALEQAGAIKGMYIGAGADAFSFRQYGPYLLLGGQAHRTGKNEEGGRYEKLREAARRWYPDSREAACWSAQDGIPSDGVPFIGVYAQDRPDWLVATGFQKWGMSTSMAAAGILADRICGRENAYGVVFDPARFSAEELPQLLKDSGQAVKGLAKRFFQLPSETVEALERGHGAVVETPEGKAGVYKTEEGEIYQVDVVCPHLGCELTWNPDERSWDCPCHGSRFDWRGNLLDGPAQEGIGDE